MDQKFDPDSDVPYDKQLLNELNKEFHSNQSRGSQALKNYAIWISLMAVALGLTLKVRYTRNRIKEINKTGGYSNISGAKVKNYIKKSTIYRGRWL